MDAGLLIARVILGLAISARGVQKRFGWPGDEASSGSA
jgi:hypothetical protein